MGLGRDPGGLGRDPGGLGRDPGAWAGTLGPGQGPWAETLGPGQGSWGLGWAGVRRLMTGLPDKAPSQAMASTHVRQEGQHHVCAPQLCRVRTPRHGARFCAGCPCRPQRGSRQRQGGCVGGGQPQGGQREGRQLVDRCCNAARPRQRQVGDRVQQRLVGLGAGQGQSAEAQHAGDAGGHAGAQQLSGGHTAHLGSGSSAGRKPRSAVTLANGSPPMPTRAGALLIARSPGRGRHRMHAGVERCALSSDCARLAPTTRMQ